jgi:hypothetical protein
MDESFQQNADNNSTMSERDGAVSRRALFTAAAAVGATTLVTSANAQTAPAGVVPGQPPVKATEGGQFRDALRRIATDTAYRNSAIQDPRKVLTDFKLSMQDLRALRDAAVLSGADVSQVDKILSQAELGPVPADACCCSCCCCGEAGVDVVLDYAPNQPLPKLAI